LLNQFYGKKEDKCTEQPAINGMQCAGKKYANEGLIRSFLATFIRNSRGERFMITRAQAMPFMNQSVFLDMADGTTRRGILHTVTNDGLYLRPMRGAGLAVENSNTKDDIHVLQQSNQSINDINDTFFPFFFFPFFFVRRIRPFFFF
jgi:hypothetical protein